MTRNFDKAWVFILLISLLLASCQAVHENKTQADCASTDVLCVGLVTGLDGIEDKSFNQAAWEGIQKAQSEHAADQVSYIETVDAKDYEQNAASLAQAGYDVIVTTGEEYSRATQSLAKAYPDTWFIGVDQVQLEVLPNVSGLVFNADQSGFLAGALAAQVTKTGVIAGIFGSDALPAMAAASEGYAAGARYINPQVEILAFSDPDDPELTLNDPKWGADASARAIQNGADVVFAAGGKTASGALLHAAEITGISCIGAEVDQWATLPGARPCLVSSAIELVSQGVFDMIKLAREGSLPSGNYIGEAGLAPYHDFDALIPQPAKDKNAQIAADLATGALTTGYVPER